STEMGAALAWVRFQVDGREVAFTPESDAQTAPTSAVRRADVVTVSDVGGGHERDLSSLEFSGLSRRERDRSGGRARLARRRHAVPPGSRPAEQAVDHRADAIELGVDRLRRALLDVAERDGATQGALALVERPARPLAMHATIAAAHTVRLFEVERDARRGTHQLIRKVTIAPRDRFDHRR